MGRGPALSYLKLEGLIIEAESAMKMLSFIFDRTVREAVRADYTGEVAKMVIALDEDEYTVLLEAEVIACERMRPSS